MIVFVVIGADPPAADQQEGDDDGMTPAELSGEADTGSDVTGSGEAPIGASPAGVYNYWLGGKDNLAIDRRVGDAVAEQLPGIVATVRANRLFLVRAVRHLAEHGVRQFLDIGPGYPTSPNVHEVARQVIPDARVVYVDNDPAVAAHGRALLARDELTAMVDGDVRDPYGFLRHRDVVRLLDWSQPVGLLMVAVLHFVPDEPPPGEEDHDDEDHDDERGDECGLTEWMDPVTSVATFRDLMVPGSWLAISHATPGLPEQTEAMRRAVEIYQQLTGPITTRPPEAVAAFFDGFDLMPPGLVRVDQWQAPQAADWSPRAHWSHRKIPPVSADQINGVAGLGRLREGG